MRRVALLLLGPAMVTTVIALLLPATPQPVGYHNFADHRAWFGIPNFNDVFFNLAFAIVGVWSLIVLFTPGKTKFLDDRQRWLYVVVFAGLILTAWGSAYYHLAPDNTRLVLAP